MYPRGKIDIGWSDLLFALRATFHAEAPTSIEDEIETAWLPGQSVVALSVRTGFDALLEALAYPPGSEILVSAITIRDMTRIIEAHGLVPVPVDLDMERLAVPSASLQAAMTPRTRAILIAHIFGSRMPLEPISAIAREYDLLLIEDCAQAYAARSDRGDPLADVSMFSFGPIKTNTALGGAILTIRDPHLLANARAVLRGYARQPAAEFRKRVVKYMGIKALSSPVTFGLFAAACRFAGKSHDEVISHALRGFPGPDLLARIRRRPSASLLSLLSRRISRFDNAAIDRREQAAREVITNLRQVEIPGRLATVHTHWVTPVAVDDPDLIMRELWRHGFDATRGASSLAVVDPPPTRPEQEPVAARRVMSRLLYLPVSPEMPRRARLRLANLTNAAIALGTRAPEPSITSRSSVPAQPR